MVTRELTGYTDEHGDLKFDVPPDFPPQVRFRVTFEFEPEEDSKAEPEEIPWDERPWTIEEIRALIKFEPKTGAEIAASGLIGAWEDQGIMDAVAWVDEVKRKRRERRAW